MGAYQLNFKFLSAVGAYSTELGYLSLNNYFVGVATGGGPTTNTDGTISFIADTISLDGGPTVPMNQLPIGFNLTNAGGNVLKNITAGFIGSLQQRVSVADSSLNSKSITKFGSLGPTTEQVNGSGSGPTFVNMTGPNISLNHVIDLFPPLSVELIVNDPTKFTTLVFRDLVLTGHYVIVSSSWIINNLTHPGSEFRAGDTGQITSVPSGTYDFSTVTQITIGSTSITVFTIQTPIEIQFVIPPAIPTGPSQPTTITNPSQFTGDALVGFVTVVIADASGVYTVIPGATHDIVYVSSQTDGTTENVAIPTPGASSGFLGG